MFRSKYSTVLTIVLILAIIAIIVVAIVLSVRAYKNYKEERDITQAIADFDKSVNEEKTQKKQEDEQEIDIENQIIQTVDETSSGEQSQGETGTSGRPRTKMYKDYPMIGYIEIQKTNIKYPILLDISPAALDVSVGVMYPSNPKLNEPGNTVIIGHNYKNGKFFSNNKKLVIGDKIKITDTTGRTLQYTIYDIQTIPENDTTYVTRDTQGKTEISLSTCTDDTKARLIILARAE